jgi:FKBP-type peptidyl-prolyl cis-trans isomerase 2
MATLSNRDRIGKALELLADGLLPFIEPRMTSAASQVGGDWVLFDFNHPLASQPVTFEVHVIGVL